MDLTYLPGKKTTKVENTATKFILGVVQEWLAHNENPLLQAALQQAHQEVAAEQYTIHSDSEAKSISSEDIHDDDEETLATSRPPRGVALRYRHANQDEGDENRHHGNHAARQPDSSP